jgi:hypothetical protein
MVWCIDTDEGGQGGGRLESPHPLHQHHRECSPRLSITPGAPATPSLRLRQAGDRDVITAEGEIPETLFLLLSGRV